jgi:hypothetical protein
VKTLAILVAAFCSITVAQAEEWQRAELYFIDWDVLTRVSLTPERVREIADSRRTFSRDLSPIVGALAINQLRPAKRPDREDARLVVDLYTDTGARVTYYASRFAFCTADSKWKHPIDVQFRRYFSRLMKSRQRSNHAMERTPDRRTLHS